MDKKLATQWGREQKMLGENSAPDMLVANTVYSRYSQFSKIKDPIFTAIIINQAGEVELFQFRPSPPPSGSRYSDYKDTAKLRLPFEGDWFVFEGGRDIYQNAGAYRDVERYAVVFTVLKDGRTFSGDGTKNQQFYCWGQPVLAPADGTVVLVNNSFVDNTPGHSEEIMPTGNRVLISHGHDEYSLLMHLKQDSIKVKNGQKVKQGEPVGECGNSGSSPAPHLEVSLAGFARPAAAAEPCPHNSSIMSPTALQWLLESRCMDNSSTMLLHPRSRRRRQAKRNRTPAEKRIGIVCRQPNLPAAC